MDRGRAILGREKPHELATGSEEECRRAACPKSSKGHVLAPRRGWGTRGCARRGGARAILRAAVDPVWAKLALRMGGRMPWISAGCLSISWVRLCQKPSVAAAAAFAVKPLPSGPPPDATPTSSSLPVSPSPNCLHMSRPRTPLPCMHLEASLGGFLPAASPDGLVVNPSSSRRAVTGPRQTVARQQAYPDGFVGKRQQAAANQDHAVGRREPERARQEQNPSWA